MTQDIHSIRGLTMDEYLSKETRQVSRTLWGTHHTTFEPYLCKAKMGDGLQLIYFGTVDQRPYYWLVLIDSQTDIEDVDFDYEKVLELIEDECGSLTERQDENGVELFAEYPEIDWAGGHWGLVANFATGKEGV